MKNCIFGIEKDEVAARITIFSLYLKLLEGEDPDILRKSAKTNSIKFPRLLNENIQRKNTLFDKITLRNEDGDEFKEFDVVVGNPPWGINPFEDPEINIDSEMNLPRDKQDVVTRFQSSQYFILMAQYFMSKDSIAGILSNKSNLLTASSHLFRKKLLEDYSLKKIYDFTNCNSILFKKHKLRTSGIKDTIEIDLGADEPATALILRKKQDSGKLTLKYITPSLDILTKLLKIITIKLSDVKTISQNFLEDDLVWRVFTAGDMEDYKLIQKLNQQENDINLRAFYGLQFKKSGEPIFRNIDYYDKDCIDHFILKEPKRINQGGKSIRRRGSFSPKQLLIKRYVQKDYRVVCAYDNEGHRFQENLIGIPTQHHDYKLLLAFFNSSLISYFLFYNSAQIGKGTYNMLHNNDLESIPILSIENIQPNIKLRLISLIDKIHESNRVSSEMLKEIDELIFDIYHLKDFEKQRIRDFFDIFGRKNRNAEIVKKDDFEKYANRFRKAFRFILKDDKFLRAEAFFSTTLGAGITFTLIEKGSNSEKVSYNRESNLARIVTHIRIRKLKEAEKIRILKQEKLKIYNNNSFTILKSNFYKDWTETEAIKDAKEEIELFIQNLPEG